MADNFRKPASAVFDGSLKSFKIDINDAEAHAVAISPLKVIREGPGQIAQDRYAVLNCLVDLAEVVVNITDAAFIADAPVKIDIIRHWNAVFSNEERNVGIIAVNPGEEFVNTGGIDLPHHGIFIPNRVNLGCKDGEEVGIVFHHGAGVIIDP